MPLKRALEHERQVDAHHRVFLRRPVEALGDSETRARPAPVELVVKPRAAHKEGKTHRICGKWPVHQRKEAAFLRRSTVVGAMGRR